MPQIFRRRSNAVSQLILAFLVTGLVGLGGFMVAFKWSAYETEVDEPIRQPIAFSHKHHVGGLGLDCRYCHSSVETSANAGMPPTHTCMTCHSQIWDQAPMLAPVRESFANDKPLEWNRVIRLPHYVYFNHSIHVNKGIGCTSCHGEVDEMPLTWKARTFYMRDCTGCHREPEKYIRPESEVFSPEWTRPQNQLLMGTALVDQYHIPKQRLTDCYTCHR